MITMISVYSDAMSIPSVEILLAHLCSTEYQSKMPCLICTAKELLGGSVSFVMFDVNRKEKHNDCKYLPREACTKKTKCVQA